jgi:iron complex outermembrane recepter protein
MVLYCLNFKTVIMKIKVFKILIAISLLILNKAESQTITGKVISNNKVIEAATILLLSAKDSSIAKAAVSDTNGLYIFENIKASQYLLHVNLSGTQPYFSNVFFIDSGANKIIETISLKEVKNLEEVVVKSTKPFIVRKIDRTVVNPDALISNAGSNALEVLEKSPGVKVNQDGIISLRGKQGVMVFIDDKPTYMSEADLAGYLRGLPSGSIDIIEIMTNPPAKYDAAGNAGIINIKLKKLKQKGLNGSISTNYAQGIYPRSNNSFNFNYRIDKWNFFSNLGYNYGNSFQDLFINRSYNNAAGNLDFTFNQNSRIRKTPQSGTGKIGADFYASKKMTIGIVYSGFKNTNKGLTLNTATTKSAANQLLNTVLAEVPFNRKNDNNSFNANLNYKFNKKTEVSAAYDYVTYDADQNNSLLNKVFNANGSLNNSTNLISKLPSNLKITSIKSDFTTTIKNGTFEYGAKSSWVNTKNIAEFFDELSGVLQPNWDFSNNFNYKENINAAYINLSWDKGKKFSFQIGTRVENTSIAGNSFGNPTKRDSSFNRNYTNFFPTIFINYKFDTLEKHVLSLNFGRRIERPNYQDMNPFLSPLDRFTLYSGNPFLQPAFAYSLELSYTYKNNFTTTLQFGLFNNTIHETIEQKTGIFYSRPGNVGKQVSYALSTNGNIAVKKWWNIITEAEVSYNKFTAIVYNQVLNNKGPFFGFATTNQFTINKQWSAEWRLNYQTGYYVGQFVTIPQYSMGAAIAKKIMKDKGSIKLNINDMFYSIRAGGDIKAVENSTANWRSRFDSRVIGLTFSYRFSKGKNLQARNLSGANDEKARVKN